MNPFDYTPAQLAKSITGALIAGLTTLGTSLADGVVDGQEWVGIALAVVITFGGVFGVSNAPVMKEEE